MKKVVLLIILFCLSAVVCFSQKSKTPVKATASKPSQVKAIAEIPDTDWRTLVDAVQSENWGKSTSLADGYLTKIKTENNKKQIARLRYILLYALAGKIVEASFANKKADEAKARIELEKAANGFLEKEFFMPSREISDDCEGKLNYVCRSKQQKNVLRVTTTNQAGTAIYSFEYLRLKQNFSITGNIGKEVILSGVLRKIEFNPNKSNVWIMRLLFENGSINVVPDR
jgi:hypothetical protein